MHRTDKYSQHSTSIWRLQTKCCGFESRCSNLEINRLLSKGMSNIYLKVSIEKSDLLKTSISWVKKFVSRSVFGVLQLTQISLNFQISFQISGVWEQNCEWFSDILILNYDVLKSKSPYFLLSKNIKFN